jgi:hypothetical protein
VVGSFTVTVTAVEPPNETGTLRWGNYYSTTSPTDTRAYEGGGETGFPTGTTTWTFTASFTETNPAFPPLSMASAREPRQISLFLATTSFR